MTAPSRNCGGSIGGLLTQYGVAFVVTVVKKDHEIATCQGAGSRQPPRIDPYVMPATCGSTLTPDPVQIPVCGVSFELALLFLELGDPRMHAISVATPRSSLPLVNLLRFINNPFAERPQP